MLHTCCGIELVVDIPDPITLYLRRCISSWTGCVTFTSSGITGDWLVSSKSGDRVTGLLFKEWFGVEAIISAGLFEIGSLLIEASKETKSCVPLLNSLKSEFSSSLMGNTKSRPLRKASDEKNNTWVYTIFYFYVSKVPSISSGLIGKSSNFSSWGRARRTAKR